MGSVAPLKLSGSVCFIALGARRIGLKSIPKLRRLSVSQRKIGVPHTGSGRKTEAAGRDDPPLPAAPRSPYFWEPCDQSLAITQFRTNTIEHGFGYLGRRVVVIGGNHHGGRNNPVPGVVDVKPILVHPILNKQLSGSFRSQSSLRIAPPLPAALVRRELDDCLVKLLT
jgi:hypothetical protein